MMRMVVSRRILCGTALAFLVLPAQASDAAKFVEVLADKVVELVKSRTGAERQAGFQEIMQASFDLPYMGRSALGTHWGRASEEQRSRFLKAAESAESKAYSERFGSYAGQTMAIGKVSPRGGGVIMVESSINQSSGPPIRVEWELQDRGAGLRVTDVRVEGVSMVMTRRSDFNAYIQRNGGEVEVLIKELESRAAR